MKKLIPIICLLLFCLGAKAQGIQFTEGTWKEILQKASEKNCPVFIDVYTSWCGPCKKMAKEIFTQKEAGDYYNAHFINYKIDAEKGEGIQIARQFNVTAYPTCLFVNADGKLISSFLGAQTVKKLIQEGEKAVKNFGLLPELEKMDETYKNGAPDIAFLQNYCQLRAEFGEKGGQPVNNLLTGLTDDELVNTENAKWIQSMTVYDEALLQRLIDLLKGMDKADKKACSSLNGAIMKAMSTFINQTVNDNQKERFEQLMKMKEQMVAIDPANEENGVMASMGGGIAYIAPEQVKMTFYIKNKYDKEFSQVFLDYLNRKMKENPTDSLIARSDATEKYYADFLKSDAHTEEEKADMRRGRGMMQLFSGVQNKLLSGTLYNAAEHYWKISKPQSEELRKQYVSWLEFFYALDRTANIGIPASEKLVELGEKEKAKQMLQNLIGFLKLKEDPDKELDKVTKALEAM